MQSTYYLLSALLVAILQLVNSEISSPKEVYGIVDQVVKVMLNTTHNNSIKGVKFGLDGGKGDPFPKFITVINKNGNIQVTCAADLDYPAAKSYKERVCFVGNLSIGHAWFIITNLKLNDTNEYMVSIREDSDDIYQHPGNIIKLIVTLPEFTDFEGIAENVWILNAHLRGTIPLTVIRKAYRNIPKEIDITYQRPNNNVVRVGFHVSFTEAVNQTYAFSFLQMAKRNGQLGGYNITCFNFTDKPFTKRNKGGHNPPGHPYDIGLIIGCVISGIIIIF